MLNKFLKISGLIVGLAFLPLISFAQIDINIPFALSNELAVEIIPNYPRQNELVFINLALYTDDLNSAKISWYQNGKLVLEGTGEKNYSFRMGKVGEESKIEIKIALLSGSTFSKKFSLTPASVDLVWEANSYVPPFYKGKALHSRQGILKVVAMPEFFKNGIKIDPKNLIYEWSNQVEAYEDQSGYGKNVLLLNGSLLGRAEEIEVLVTDRVNNLVADGFITIAPTDPEIVFYENDPYYGQIYDQAILNNFKLKGSEVQILAAPYYFTKERVGGLKYEWRLNNVLISSLLDSRTAIFKKPEESGQSKISLSIENLNRILQQADNSLIMQFEN